VLTHSVAVPTWLLVLLAAFAAWALLDRLLVPSVRWYLRRRVEKIVEGVNRRLAIKLQPFKLIRRQVLVDRLQYDPVVLEASEAFAQEEGVPRAVAHEKVLRYSEEIVPAFNAYIYFRVGYWIARRVAQALYRVRLGSVDEEALAALPEKAAVVFLMNHRSNMDYVLVAYMVAGRSALSYAVGEWARVWPLESLIRSMGAYFVRRRSRNPLYRSVLQRYVRMATAAGVTQAVYPEGGLSRDGKLLPPKLGLLDYMLRDFDPNKDPDIIFIPVGINYDRTLEDRTLLLDLEPPGTKRQSRGQALATFLRFLGRNAKLLSLGRWYRFGYACVNLGTPISASEYLRDKDLRFKGMPREERFKHIEHFGEQLMDKIGQVIPVLPVSLVATVFARDPEARWSELEIKAQVQNLIPVLESQGATVYIPRQNRDYAITVGLRMLTLRRLVSLEDVLFRVEPEHLSVIRYYANSIAHFCSRDKGVQSGLEIPVA